MAELNRKCEEPDSTVDNMRPIHEWIREFVSVYMSGLKKEISELLPSRKGNKK